MERSNLSSSEEWMARNLMLLSNDPRENSFGLEEQEVGEKVGDSSLKDEKPK